MQDFSKTGILVPLPTTPHPAYTCKVSKSIPAGTYIHWILLGRYQYSCSRLRQNGDKLHAIELTAGNAIFLHFCMQILLCLHAYAIVFACRCYCVCMLKLLCLHAHVNVVASASYCHSLHVNFSESQVERCQSWTNCTQ